MSISTSYGKTSDIHESLNGDNGNLVYLTSRSEVDILDQYNSIKSAKSIIAAYSQNSKHVLLLMVGGNVKKVIRKTKSIKNIGSL